MATLNIENKIVVFNDPTVNSNPRLRYVDWYRPLSGISVANPKSEGYQIAPNEEVTVFDTFGAVVGLNTATISSIVGFPYNYRIDNIPSTINTLLTVSPNLVSITVNPNSTATFTFDAPFGVSPVGGLILLTGPFTGDAQTVNPLNEGYWKVRSASGTTVVCTRESPTFCGISETFSPAIAIGNVFTINTTNNFVVGAKVKATATSLPVGATYQVVVSGLDFVVLSTNSPVVDQTIADAQASMVSMVGAKSFTYIEGSGTFDITTATSKTGVSPTTQTVGISPLQMADGTRLGWMQFAGTLPYLKIKNTSDSSLHVTVISGE